MSGGCLPVASQRALPEISPQFGIVRYSAVRLECLGLQFPEPLR